MADGSMCRGPRPRYTSCEKTQRRIGARISRLVPRYYCPLSAIVESSNRPWMGKMEVERCAITKFKSTLNMRSCSRHC